MHMCMPSLSGHHSLTQYEHRAPSYGQGGESVDRTTGKLLINMKPKISIQCPSLLVFYSFLKYILYREGSQMGGPDGDGMFACDRTCSFHTIPPPYLLGPCVKMIQYFIVCSIEIFIKMPSLAMPYMV